MNTPKFDKAIDSLTKRGMFQLLFHRVLNILLFSSSMSLIVAIIISIVGKQQIYFAIVPIIQVIPPTVGLILLLTPGVRNQTASILKADAAYNTRELFISAWEISGKKKLSNIEKKLLYNAEQRASIIEPDNLFPVKIKVTHLVAGVLLILTYVILFVPLNFAFDRSPDQLALTEAKILQEMAERLSARSEESFDPTGQELAKKLNELSRRLYEGKMSRKEAGKSIEKLREELNERIEELMRDATPAVGEQNNSETFPEDPAETYSLRRNELSPQDLQYMKQRFLLSEDLNAQELEQLKRALDAVEEGTATDNEIVIPERIAEELGLNREKKLRELEEIQRELAQSEDRLQENENEIASNNEGETTPGENEESPSNGTGQGESGDTPSTESTGDDFASEGGEGYNPDGNQTGRESRDSPLVRSTEELELQKLEGKKTNEDSSALLLRALPEASPGSLGEEELLLQYRRQAETAVMSDSVPDYLKPLVRDYFVELGLYEIE